MEKAVAVAVEQQEGEEELEKLEDVAVELVEDLPESEEDSAESEENSIE